MMNDIFVVSYKYFCSKKNEETCLALLILIESVIFPTIFMTKSTKMFSFELNRPVSDTFDFDWPDPTINTL